MRLARNDGSRISAYNDGVSVDCYDFVAFGKVAKTSNDKVFSPPSFFNCRGFCLFIPSLSTSRTFFVLSLANGDSTLPPPVQSCKPLIPPPLARGG
ncbi:hypothetical protein [Helicobacter sp. T3_23-1059]